MHDLHPHSSRWRAAVAAFAFVALAASGAPVARAQALGGSVTVTPTAFSPDGDGVEDVATVRYTLLDSLAELSIVVLAADTLTPVDTLRAPAPEGVPGLHTIAWDGRDASGAVVADGLYWVRLFARPATAIDTTVTLPVSVDLTPPVVTVFGASPAVYAPDLPGAPSVLSVTFHAGSVSPSAPGRVPDELQVEVLDPSGQPLDAADLAGRIAWTPPPPVTDPPSILADGDMTMTWDATGQTGLVDGDHTVRVLVVDAAGHTAVGETVVRLDVSAPEIHFDAPTPSSRIRVVPDSLSGWARDGGGIDTLRIRYPASDWLDLVPMRVSGDTTFFRALLADSIPGDGSWTISVQAVDGPGRTATAALTFTLDATAPPPPVLDPFDGVWHSTTFTVTGTMPDLGEPEAHAFVRRNGVVVDSAFTIVSTDLAVTIPLVSGVNVIDAVMVDAAGNVSGPSNALRVVFDESPGLFVPVPFRPGDRFTVGVATPARRVTLRIYDTSGDLVARLGPQETAATRYDFAWNGTPAGGGRVRRGPLVVVATVRDDAGVHRLRRVFLFDPGR